MRCTDTDSKGLCIFKTRRGTYFSLAPEELQEALEVIKETKNHVDSGKKRVYIDSRRNY